MMVSRAVGSRAGFASTSASGRSPTTYAVDGSRKEQDAFISWIRALACERGASGELDAPGAFAAAAAAQAEAVAVGPSAPLYAALGDPDLRFFHRLDLGRALREYDRWGVHVGGRRGSVVL